MIQAEEQCLKKWMEAGHDLYLDMLMYQAPALSSSLPAPAELQDGGKYRALLPTRSLMKDAHRQIVRDQMVDNKERSAEYYNKSVRDPLPLPMQQEASVQVTLSRTSGLQQPSPTLPQ